MQAHHPALTARHTQFRGRDLVAEYPLSRREVRAGKEEQPTHLVSTMRR
jgi:hypothetical protein